MTELNIIPGMRAAGKFEANIPFDRVVDPSTFYTVEAIRTIPEMQGLNIDIYSRVFKPVGLAQEDYAAVIAKGIAEKTVVVSLIPRTGPPVYVLSTYLKSFPLIDGWSYERMCLVVNFGPLAEDMKEPLKEAQDHFKDYVLTHYGIDATVQLGTIPIIGYVSQEEHELQELTRQNRITDRVSDLGKINELTAQVTEQQAYILDLERRLGAIPTPTPPVTPDP